MSLILCISLLALLRPSAAQPIPANASMDSSVNVTIPEAQNRTKLSLLATINYGGNYFPSGPQCSKAMELALDRLHEEPGFLKDKYQLSIDLFDDKCDDVTIVRGVLPQLLYVKHRLPVAVINDCPTTGQQTLAKVLKTVDMLGFSYNPAEGFDDLDRRNSKLIQLQSLSLQQYYRGPVNMLRQFGWRRISIFSEIHPYFNVVEKFLIKLFEQNDITVAWMDKVNYRSDDEVEMDTAVAAMKRSDPRIMLANTDAPVSLSCWLYKHGLYGLGYVVVASSWSNYDPETVDIPEYVASWCTRDMLTNVVRSWIFFGPSLMADIHGDSYTDSTGLSIPQFKAEMYKKIVTPNFFNIFMWQCYDTVLFVGKTIELGLDLARSRNLSFLDVMESSEVFEEAAFFLRINGTKGLYDIDPITKSNTGGYTAYTFTQKRQEGKLLGNVIFGYYKASHNLFINLNGGSVWTTLDGNPPKDKVHHLLVIEPANSSVTVFISIAVVSALIAGCVVIIIIIFIKFKRTETIISIFILIGNIFILLHVYFIPIESRGPNSVNLFIISLLLLLGFSMSSLGLLIKLREEYQAIELRKWPGLKLQFSYWKKHLFLVIWPVLNVGLVVAFNANSVFIVKERFWDPYVSSDRNIIYEPYQLEFAFSAPSLVFQILLITTAFIHGMILLIQIFSAYLLIAELKLPETIVYFPDMNILENMKADCWTAYCQFLIILAAAVAVSTTGIAERLMVLITIFTFLYVGLYFIISHLKQTFQQKMTTHIQRLIRNKYKSRITSKRKPPVMH